MGKNEKAIWQGKCRAFYRPQVAPVAWTIGTLNRAHSFGVCDEVYELGEVPCKGLQH